jgi:tetratricopeptide (TPR) repeat protein
MKLLKQDVVENALSDQNDEAAAALSGLLAARVFRGPESDDSIRLAQVLIAEYPGAVGTPDAFAAMAYKLRQMEQSINERFQQIGLAYELRAFESAAANGPGSPNLPPSYLLDSRRAVVPFSFRHHEMAELSRWLNTGVARLSVLLLHGPGGAGKTRLAAAFAADALGQSWSVVEATELRGTPPSGSRRPQIAERLLILVDYAERWDRRSLISLIIDMSHSDQERIRILLLSRPGQPFWKHIRKDISDAFEKLEPLELSVFAEADLASREAAFDAAAAAFAAKLDTSEEGVQRPSGLMSSRYDRPLDLHMAALAAVLAHRSREEPPRSEDLSAYLIDHERRTWGDDADEILEQTVLLATLIGPVFDNALAREILLFTALAGSDAEAELIIRRHELRYPQESAPIGERSMLTPLRPDRFGEDFVGLTLLEANARQRVHAILTNPSLLSDQMLRQALAVLSASGLRNQRAAEAVFRVVVTRPNLIGIAPLSTINLVRTQANFDFANWFLRRVPPRRDERSEAAANLAVSLVSNADIGWPLYDQYVLWFLASSHFSRAGVIDHAIEPMSHAVEIARQLDQQDPNQFGTLVAVALHALAEAMWEAGDAASAIAFGTDAVERYRTLAQTVGIPYRRELALSLITLGIILAEGVDDVVGGLAATEESVAIFRELADSNGTAHIAGLQVALHNLGARLDQAQRSDEALQVKREALDLARQLAQQSQDQYDGQLAAALVNYSMGLMSQLSDYQNATAIAEEAAEIRRRQASLLTEAPLRDLGRALLTLGRAYIGGRRIQDARVAIDEARHIFRPLAHRSQAYTEILIESEQELRRLNAMNTEDDHFEAPLSDEDDIVEEARSSPFIDSDNATERRLALSLLYSGTQQDRDAEDAIARLREAAELFRKSIETGLDYDRFHLAQALKYLAQVYIRMGDAESSVRYYRESIAALSELGSPTGPHPFEDVRHPNFSSQRNEEMRFRLEHQLANFELAEILESRGALDESLAAAAAAVSSASALIDSVGEDRLGPLPALIGCLGKNGWLLIQLQRFPEAIEVLNRAAALSAEVTAEPRNRRSHEVNVRTQAQILRWLIPLLSPTDDAEQLINASTQLVASSRSLVELGVEDANNTLIVSLANHAGFLNVIGGHEQDAASHGKEAVDLAHAQTTETENNMYVLAAALIPYAIALANLGEASECIQLYEESTGLWKELASRYGPRYFEQYFSAFRNHLVALRAAQRERPEIIEVLDRARGAFADLNDDRLLSALRQILTVLVGELRDDGQVSRADEIENELAGIILRLGP